MYEIKPNSSVPKGLLLLLRMSRRKGRNISPNKMALHAMCSAIRYVSTSTPGARALSTCARVCAVGDEVVNGVLGDEGVRSRISSSTMTVCARRAHDGSCSGRARPQERARCVRGPPVALAVSSRARVVRERARCVRCSVALAMLVRARLVRAHRCALGACGLDPLSACAACGAHT